MFFLSRTGIIFLQMSHILSNKGLIQRRRQRISVWAGYGATYVRLAQKNGVSRLVVCPVVFIL